MDIMMIRRSKKSSAMNLKKNACPYLVRAIVAKSVDAAWSPQIDVFVLLVDLIRGESRLRRRTWVFDELEGRTRAVCDEWSVQLEAHIVAGWCYITHYFSPAL